ncbi:hypothetical protein R6L23_00940 [Streptomyces sp. SR27]|uniref:hypothetical protein n=1 Tax=Streptomyces sp. SR27 TaxID=3076630 RepID=UPI00295BEA1E|nr:hypothetical protein [Streptomyces sp. SR27]MDV9186815.1 hypothetical protein [Streptomyces sp. SR27]
MARTTSAAMRELMRLSGASQTQIERWQKRGFLPRFPRAYAGGGGSESELSEEIIERARVLIDHARQGTLTMGPISLIATLSEPDVALLREAVIENLVAGRRRLGMDVRADSPQEASRARLGAAERKVRRSGRTWNLENVETGPVREVSPYSPELMALFYRDSDEEVDADDLEVAVDGMVELLKENVSRLSGVPVGALPPDLEANIRADARRRLLAVPTYRDQCDLVRSAPDGLLLRACRLVPQVRRVQVAAVESARLAYALHTGALTVERLGTWHDYAMPVANIQRMQADPMWTRWGSPVISAGAVSDSGDGPRIVVCLEEPNLLDELELFVDFLASLIPVHALHRLAFHRPEPGGRTVK